MPPATAVVHERRQTPRDRRVRSRRRVLCVFPRYAHSFGTFEHAYPLMGVRAFMPPQGLLVVAAYLPEEWEVRFVDENVCPAKAADYEWADVVLVSGMHVQREHLGAIARRAHAVGKIAAAGGPSVSACPEWYPQFDMLHVGELGDATDALISRLDDSVARPERQEVYTTHARLPLHEFPVPAYHHVDLDRYFLASAQFSSGCPYRCEFCDIPELYGRRPRLKRPEHVVAELDAMLSRGNPGAVYFVDDNFIADPRAASQLLDVLGAWQEARGYPVEFACEATLNIAQRPDILRQMQSAYFTTVFCGIESPQEDALRAIGKTQNLRQPILDAVRTLNSYGLEVVSGMIVGFDTDTPSTGERIVEFAQESGIPMLTVNLLHALPKTPLWRRLAAEGRLLHGEGRDSNVDFRMPYDQVVQMWQDCVARIYAPEALLDRFAHQALYTYPRRKRLPVTPARLNWRNVRRGLTILLRVLWHEGIQSDYRRRFWRFAGPLLRQGDIETVIHVGLVAHHLIRFARECSGAAAERAFYSGSRRSG